MISTKNLISDLQDVPNEWVFEYYLDLKEKLTGQDIKMLSAFNSKDKIPSMFVYFDVSVGYYKFKDFSSGYQGDCTTLVQRLFNLKSNACAYFKIINDYQDFVNQNTSYTKPEIKFHDKFKVVDYEMRHWNTLDAKYWGSFKISSRILKKYNVVPLSYFKMEKSEEDGTVTSFVFKKSHLYGYFRDDGSLYKIYMPKNINKKFIKVENYIQGLDQLKYDTKYLLITSSLKDLMCFDNLGIGNIGYIAPDSENTMIGESVINKLKPHYSKIIVLFDNDEPGIKAAQRYKDKYGFDNVILPLSKDLSDSVKDYGIDYVRSEILKLLKEKV